MKRLLFFLILPLSAMSPKTTPRIKMQKHVSWDKDMNSYPLPGQIQLEDDVKYLGTAYDQMRDKINEQTRIIRVFDTELHAYMIRTDLLVNRVEELERKVNKLPWYKRINCFRRK